jgi:hypothetical protein
MDKGEVVGLFPRVGDYSVGPVNTVGFQIGNVRLGSAQVPTQTIKIPHFRILLALNDTVVLFQSNGPLILEFDFRPEPLWDERPREPVHREAVVVELPKMNIGADRAAIDAVKQMLGL